MSAPVRSVSVSVQGYGEATFVGATASAAFMEAFRSLQSARDCTFKEFLKISTRKTVPNAPGVGEPIRVLGRNAWTTGQRGHEVPFLYDGEKVVMTAHHSDVETGHGEAAA